MFSHTPSNTINFDHARLQRAQQNQRKQSPLTPVSLPQLRQQLNVQLQSSLEIDRVLELFFREIQQLVPLSALSYQMHTADLRLELGERATQSANYRLSYEGEYLGELSFKRHLGFSEVELSQLETLLACLLFPLRNSLLYRSALQSALRDGLTGAGNRIAMNQALQRECDLAQRSLQPLSVLMLDIDHFKNINDRFGHSYGDEVLKAVASTLKDNLRNIDMVFRYGGEEFLVLLSNTNSNDAQMIGERLRKSVESLAIETLSELHISISLGCATLLPGESADELQKRADSALYTAKRSGRNRLSLAG